MFPGSRPHDFVMSSDISIDSSWSIHCVSLGGMARLNVLVETATELVQVYIVHFILVVVRSVLRGKGARLFCAQRSSSRLATFSTIGLQSMNTLRVCV